MAHLELWKLGADIVLLGALGWLSICILRSQTGGGRAQSHGLELERTLRALVKEADLASSSLHDQLLRRQQSLERLLRDIEGVEQRVNRAVSVADTRTSSVAAPNHHTPPPAGRAREVSTIPEAPSFNAVAKPARSTAKAPTPVKTNIFGEPIGESRPAAPQPPSMVRAEQTPLTASIEREVVPPTAPPASPKVARETPAESLGEVRRAAEELLRAGRDLEFVARRTNLPIDEIRLLSNAVLRDAANRGVKNEPPAVEQFVAEAHPVVETDPRLGVLSPIRRSIETV